MKNLTLGSLFDGSGTCLFSALTHGITPVWASEIEPFPITVTHSHFPNVTHYGDISQMDGSKIQPVDIITFGSPCQDLSMAGTRTGLENGSRSSLFFEAIRVIKEMYHATDEKYPRFIMWENVPGALSSGKGQDFRRVLEEITQIKHPNLSVPMPEKGKWTKAGNIVADAFSLCWRVIDAQYFGVPQRRRRIFLVADFGNECSSEILFERQSLSGHTEPCEAERQKAAGSAGTSLDSSGRDFVLNDMGGGQMSVSENKTATLRSQSHAHNPVIIDNRHNKCEYTVDNVSQTIKAQGGNRQPILIENHGNDSRYTLQESVPTLSSRLGTGGGQRANAD